MVHIMQIEIHISLKERVYRKKLMRIVQIIGHPNSGKTTLITEIIAEFKRRSIRVGTIKHSAHLHELDRPGKDSYRHRKAGAETVAMITGKMTAVYLDRKPKDDLLALITILYQNMDVILIEGWLNGPFDKIESLHNSIDRVPLYKSVANTVAVVSDTPLELRRPQFSKEDPAAIADFILERPLLNSAALERINYLI